MILNQEKSNAEIQGEIKNNKVEIDAKNINFITTLLTSNLYSLPIESFFRETVSNAWDSQVEAGNTNTPILIKLTGVNEEDVSVSIRDYGTGLSPERFDNIYRFIGSSTKRESNDYIGMIGIGRFAALAVNDVVNIKSYYEGKCYSYLMYKDNETLNIDLLNTTDTEYENGVEVEVLIKNAWNKSRNIIKGLQSLTYFEQIYVDSDVTWLKDYINDFNNREIHEFDTFNVCSIADLEGINILMGNVLYKYDKAVNLADFKGLDIAIKFNIGDLDVTPNREDIRYSNKTVESLNNKLSKVVSELNKIVEQSTKEDFSSLWELNCKLSQYYYYVTLYKFKCYYNNFTVSKTYLYKKGLKTNYTLNGKKLPENLIKYYKVISRSIIDNALIYNYDSYTFRVPKHIELSILYRRSLILTEDYYKPLTKQYIRDVLLRDENTIIIKSSKLKYLLYNTFFTFIKWLGEDYNKNSKENIYECVRIIYNDICERFKEIKTFNNSDVPQDWIATHKPVKSNTDSGRRDLVLYRYVYNRRGDVSFDSKSTLDCYLRSNNTIVYGEKGAEELSFMFKLFSDADETDVIFLGTAKSNILKLRAVNKFIPIETYLFKKNDYFVEAFTIKYAVENDLQTDYCQCYEANSKSYIGFVTKLNKYKSRYNRFNDILRNAIELKLYNDLYTYYVKNNWLDNELLDNLKDSSYRKFSDLISNMNTYGYNDRLRILLYCLIIKNKINLKDCSYKNVYKELINML